MSATEERLFPGDPTFWLYLGRLAEGPRPLPTMIERILGRVASE